MTSNRTICEGRHLPCCATCRHWIPNLQTSPTEMDDRLRPQLFSGKCADWRAKTDRPAGSEL